MNLSVNVCSSIGKVMPVRKIEYTRVRCGPAGGINVVRVSKGRAGY